MDIIHEVKRKKKLSGYCADILESRHMKKTKNIALVWYFQCKTDSTGQTRQWNTLALCCILFLDMLHLKVVPHFDYYLFRLTKTKEIFANI